MKKRQIQSVMIVMMLNGGIAVAAASDDVPPPPGPYSAATSMETPVPAAMPWPGVDEMRKRHEQMVKEHEESMRKRRQDMIKRYQTLRDQGFRPEQEENTRTTTTLKPAEPEWVREQREAMQAMREQYQAEQEKRLAAQREALDGARRQETQQALPAVPRPGAAVPGWYAMPRYPAPPYVYGTPYPVYPGMTWAPMPPAMLHIPVPMTQTPSAQGE